MLRRILLSGFFVVSAVLLCSSERSAWAQIPGVQVPGSGVPTYELPVPGGGLGAPGAPYRPDVLGPWPLYDLTLPTAEFLVRPPTQRAPHNIMPYELGALPEYSPRGVRIDGLTLYPSLSALPTYNSNVFATPNNAKSDAIMTVAPEFIGISRSERNTLDFEANAEFNQYVHYNDQSNTNASLGVGDVYELAPGRLISGGVSYDLLHLDPALEETVARQPTEYHVASASFGFLQRPTRFGYALDSVVSHFDYGPLHPASGGTVSQADNDYLSVVLAPTAFYELTPIYTLFSRLALNTYIYDQHRDRAGLRRDSYGGKFDVGTRIDITRTLAGEVFAGVLYQKYVEPVFGDQLGPDFGAALGWSITDETLIGLRALRSIQQTRARSASTEGTSESFSATESQITLSVDHLLYSNLLLHADVGYTQDDFQTGNRTDRQANGRIAMLDYINRYINTGPEIDYIRRFSDLQEARYNRLLVMYRVTGQF